VSRVIRIVAATSVALVLTGCGLLDARPVPSRSDAATPSATAPATLTPEDAFVAEYLSLHPESADQPRQQWIDIGVAVCEALTAGATGPQVAEAMQNTGVTADQAAVLVVLAATHLCPQFAPPAD
jgi:hypothetical protein